MMLPIQWRESYSVGVPALDNQHRRLLEIINELAHVVTTGGQSDIFFAALDALVRYAETHFSDEERILRETGYPALADQQQEHDRFVSHLVQTSEKLHLKKAKLPEETVDFLKTWYIEHILGKDQEYKPFLVARGAQSHPPSTGIS
jgi:hemerythrin